MSERPVDRLRAFSTTPDGSGADPRHTQHKADIRELLAELASFQDALTHERSLNESVVAPMRARVVLLEAQLADVGQRATELMELLQPWALHGQRVQTAATRLVMALAAVSVADSGPAQDLGEQRPGLADSRSARASSEIGTDALRGPVAPKNEYPALRRRGERIKAERSRGPEEKKP